MSKIAVVFPGQGSQRIGMGQDFYNDVEVSRQVFEEASDAIGLDLTKLCFEENDQLDLTEFTQPAILTTEIAIFKALIDRVDFKADIFAGHSLGEYTALVAAGVINLGDAVQIVRKRGALMQAVVPEGVGAMAALVLENISETNYIEIVMAAKGEIANFNSLSQTVISGKAEAVNEASLDLKKTFPEMDVITLNVSAPFHSSLMSEIETEFSEVLQSFAQNFSLENVKNVASNFSGDFHQSDTLLENLVKQISGSVRWIDNMKLIGKQASAIYEIGPNRPLGRFFSTLDIKTTSIINLRSLKKAFAS